MNDIPKRLTFVLPGLITVPMGGVKVVNRLAELLSEKGYMITLVYPVNLEIGILQNLRSLLKNYLDKRNNVATNLYYQPSDKVDAIVINEISEKYLPDSDYVIAVGWQTAGAVNSLSGRKGKKFYFLQSFEAYFTGSSKILETYKLPLTKIALSNWIIKEMVKLGQKAVGPIGNAINPDEFYIDESIEKTNDILMLYHPAKIKNAKFGLTILSNLKKQNSKLNATIFSARKPIHKIPEWIKVVIRPEVAELRDLYNSSKVYFSTSKWEGWGLTAMEAMACGCSIVAIKNQGVLEFLKNNDNAFVINEKDKTGAIEKITKLLNNESLREKFLQESNKTLANYSEIEISSRFENCLINKG